MSISMRKRGANKNRLPHIIAFVIAIVLALVSVSLLPVDFQIKKTLFFLLIVVFAILGVLIPNLMNSRRK